MAARVVRKHSSVMVLGIDHHNGIYYYNLFTGLGALPGPPVPIPPGLLPIPPFSFHGVSTVSNWVSLEDKSNATVLADGAPVVSRNHAAKHPVHVPPGGNLMLPITMIFGSSTWKLGVDSVKSTHGSLASTLTGSAGATINCGDPISLPTGGFDAPGSVHITPAPGDFRRVAEEWAIQAAIELAFAYGMSKLAPGVKLWVLKNFWQRFSKPIQREAAIEAAREATRRALSAERDVFLQQALENDGKRVADAARRKIDGDSVSKLANEGEEAEAQRVADEFNKKAEQRANQAAERAGDLYDGGADPGKAADVATDEATQDAFHREAAEQGRPMPGMKGAGVGPVAGEHARNNVKDALPESAVEEHAGKGVPVDYGLESAKGTAIEKASDKTKKALDIQQDDPTKKDE